MYKGLTLFQKILNMVIVCPSVPKLWCVKIVFAEHHDVKVKLILRHSV